MGRLRNPIRLKNLSARYLPLYLVGLWILVFHPIDPLRFVWAVPTVGLGLAIRTWAAGHLVKSNALTRTGPYAHLRHPLYAGTLLIATGLALLLGGALMWIVLLIAWSWFALVYFPRKERVESARLQSLYGARYLRYRDAVPPLRPRRTAWADPLVEVEEPGRSEGWSFERYSDNNELGTLLAVLGGLAAFGLRSLWGAS
jgi:protein-S-isoprenylcysteine O-methyltransferase Ste14